MDLFGSFVIACSMYSRIPMPQVDWTENRMKYAMCFFPLIGVGMGSSPVADCFDWRKCSYSGRGKSSVGGNGNDSSAFDHRRASIWTAIWM